MVGFDSGLKLADRFAQAFEEAGASVRIASPTARRSTLTADQAGRITARPVRFASWDALVDAALGADVAVPILDGSRVEDFFRDVHGRSDALGRPRPVLGAAYVGMVLYGALGGYLWRSLADVLAVNSHRDFAEFSAAATSLGLPAGNLLLTGLSLLPAAPAAPGSGPLQRVLFADQPTVPGRVSEREYLYRRLDDYARLHPEREVLVRPRHRRSENTFHRMRYSPEDFAEKRRLAANLRVDHTPIGERLASTDLLLTVSSTAALEALALGVRVALVGDLVGEAYLNGRLLDSGLVRTFDEIDADRIGIPSAEWLADVFPAQDGGAPAERFAARALELVGSTQRPHDAAWAHPFSQTRVRLADARRGERPSPASRLASLARRVLR